MLAPIVVLPTVAGLANVLGPLLIGFVFGGPSPALIEVIVVAVVGVLAWLFVATAIGAWLDLGLAGEALDEIGVPGSPRLRSIGAARAVAVRMLPHVPTALVVAWAAVAIVDATYQELIAPGAPSLPLPIRVVLRIPDPIALVVFAWLLGEAIGGIAIRRVAGGAPVVRALGEALIAFARASSIATFVVTGLVVDLALGFLVIVPAGLFQQVRVLLGAATGGLEPLVALALLIASWLAGLLLLAAALAWRQVAWTLETVRPAALPERPSASASG